MRYFVQGLCALVFVMFWGFGLFGHAGTDKFVTENLYEALHPCSVINVIGVILFHVTLFYASGLWVKLIGEQLLPVGSSWPNIAAFGVGFLGIVLIFV